MALRPSELARWRRRRTASCLRAFVVPCRRRTPCSSRSPDGVRCCVLHLAGQRHARATRRSTKAAEGPAAAGLRGTPAVAGGTVAPGSGAVGAARDTKGAAGDTFGGAGDTFGGAGPSRRGKRMSRRPKRMSRRGKRMSRRPKRMSRRGKRMSRRPKRMSRRGKRMSRRSKRALGQLRSGGSAIRPAGGTRSARRGSSAGRVICPLDEMVTTVMLPPPWPYRVKGSTVSKAPRPVDHTLTRRRRSRHDRPVPSRDIRVVTTPAADLRDPQRPRLHVAGGRPGLARSRVRPASHHLA
jgi:hypothetical protein